MIDKLKGTLTSIISVILLCVIVYGAFSSIKWLVIGLLNLNSDIAVAVIAASASLLVAAVTVVLGKLYEARAIIQKEHRDRKAPIYEALIKFLMRIVMSVKTEKPITESEMMEFLEDFNQRVMVWGSDGVLAAWVKWRSYAINQDMMKTNPLGLMFLYEEVIYQIRRDLGHSNVGLKRGDILKLFINDIDNHL